MGGPPEGDNNFQTHYLRFSDGAGNEIAPYTGVTTVVVPELGIISIGIITLLLLGIAGKIKRNAH